MDFEKRAFFIGLLVGLLVTAIMVICAIGITTNNAITKGYIRSGSNIYSVTFKEDLNKPANPIK